MDSTNKYDRKFKYKPGEDNVKKIIITLQIKTKWVDNDKEFTHDWIIMGDQNNDENLPLFSLKKGTILSNPKNLQSRQTNSRPLTTMQQGIMK